jgi:hypothetical protein
MHLSAHVTGLGLSAALHHAIDKVEKPSLGGIRHHDPTPHQSRTHHHLVSFLLLSFVS